MRPLLQCVVERATRLAVPVVASALILACSLRAGTDEGTVITMDTVRHGSGASVYHYVEGDYLYPRRSPLIARGACDSSGVQPTLSEIESPSIEDWSRIVDFNEAAKHGAFAIDNVCAEDSEMVEEGVRLYEVRWFGEWEYDCFVRSDENRPETNAFLDLLDRVIDESIDCPGS